MTNSAEGDLKSATESSQSQPQQPSPPPPQGYPFPPPYQGYPPPSLYQGYPNNNYQYGPPPPPGYYSTTPHSFVLIGPPQRSHGYKLARVFLSLMIIIFFGMSVMSLLTWLIYGSDIPVIYADSLEMTIFNSNNAAFNATWSGNVSVRNPSHTYEVSYDYVEATLVYKDHLLDTNYINPFVLTKNERRSFNFKFAMPNPKQKNIVGATWINDIEKEKQQRGAISFDMRIIVNVVFRNTDNNDHHQSMSRTLKILCGELEVVFPSTTDNVAKINDGYKECLILSN